jgi:hypothetical protein
MIWSSKDVTLRDLLNSLKVPPRAWLAACLIFIIEVTGFARFVSVDGDRLALNGETVYIKGSNYYPKNHYWQYMWPDWDPPQITHELDLLQGMGGNTIRVLVPYGMGWTDGDGNVNPTYLSQLEQLVSWCSERGMRPIFTLFDWHTDWAPAGSDQETRDLRYLSTIVNRFRDDPRVLLWDIKNEPDNPGYGGWDDIPENYPKIDWLERMCNATKANDPNHPVGVGMTAYHNCYYGINGKSIHSFTDVILFHNYNAPDTQRQINDLEAWGIQYGIRPIIMEEGGWPTNPAYDPSYTEAKQLNYYQQVMPVIDSSGITGFVQWVLVDFDPGVGNSDDWFGLLRADYSRKPAADVFQTNYTVSPFPEPPPPPLDLRIDLAPTDVPEGIQRVDVTYDGETDAYADIAGRSCRKPRTSTDDNYIYFDCDDSKIFGDTSDVYVAVDYLDGGGGSWLFEYDGLSGPYTIVLPPVTVNSGPLQWLTAVFHLTDANFINRQNGGSDFRVNAYSYGDGGYDDWFSNVRVYVETPTATPTPLPTDTPTSTPTATSPPSPTPSPTPEVTTGLNAGWYAY